MNKLKMSISAVVIAAASLLSINAVAQNATHVTQSYTKTPVLVKKAKFANSSQWEFQGQFQVVNSSQEIIYVHIPGASYDMKLYPAGSGENVDYVDFTYYDPNDNHLPVTILADDDYTPLITTNIFDGDTFVYDDYARAKK